MDLLAVQGTLKSLLQHYNLKAFIFRHSAFFRVQLSHLYMTTGKTIALTIWAFVEFIERCLVLGLNLGQFGQKGWQSGRKARHPWGRVRENQSHKDKVDEMVR